MSRSRRTRGRDESRPFHPLIGDALAARGRVPIIRPAAPPAQVGARFIAPGPPPAAATPADDDRLLFERALTGARPLPPGPGRVTTSGRAAEARPRASRPSASAAPAELVVERRDGELTGARFGVSHETLRYLARGEFLAEARCDLHGLRADAARRRLRGFIEESVARGRRAVLVVCGRGLHSGPTGPVLLDVASQTLARSAVTRHVQAFASATPSRGGAGALMVLLRRESAPEAR